MLYYQVPVPPGLCRDGTCWWESGEKTAASSCEVVLLPAVFLPVHSFCWLVSYGTGSLLLFHVDIFFNASFLGVNSLRFHWTDLLILPGRSGNLGWDRKCFAIHGRVWRQGGLRYNFKTTEAMDRRPMLTEIMMPQEPVEAQEEVVGALFILPSHSRSPQDGSSQGPPPLTPLIPNTDSEQTLRRRRTWVTK